MVQEQLKITDIGNSLLLVGLNIFHKLFSILRMQFVFIPEFCKDNYGIIGFANKISLSYVGQSDFRSV